MHDGGCLALALNLEMEQPRNSHWYSFTCIMNLPNTELVGSTMFPAGETISLQQDSCLSCLLLRETLEAAVVAL